jgi:hypothetical protein
MAKWLCALLAMMIIGIGLKTLHERHAQLPSVRGMADELGDDEPGWEIHGWPAILIGGLEVALGLCWLVQTLDP